MKRMTVSAGLVRSVLDFAASLGADRADLMDRIGLADPDIADQDARVALDTYRVLVRAAQVATGDPAFMLHHGMGTELTAFSVVGLIVHSSPSMAEAMVELNRYSKLVVEVDVMEEGEQFAFEPSPEGVWIVDNRPDPNSFPELTESSFARFESEFRREFPDKPFALALTLTYPAPTHASVYEEVFRCPITFDAPRNGMLISPAWLTQEFDAHSGYVFGLFTDKADALLTQLEAATTLSGQIEAYLMPILHKGDVSVETVAKDMGMSRQTLYRRLKEEGETFAGLLDGLRLRMARDYLAARKVSINETAYLVGFSEPASFVRAFKRWTGQTPSQFRAET